MKVFNGVLAGFTLASMILDWSGVGQIMILCVGCYVFGYLAANRFFMGKDDEDETRTND